MTGSWAEAVNLTQNAHSAEVPVCPPRITPVIRPFFGDCNQDSRCTASRVPTHKQAQAGAPSALRQSPASRRARRPRNRSAWQWRPCRRLWHQCPGSHRHGDHGIQASEARSLSSTSADHGSQCVSRSVSINAEKQLAAWCHYARQAHHGSRTPRRRWPAPPLIRAGAVLVHAAGPGGAPFAGEDGGARRVLRRPPSAPPRRNRCHFHHLAVSRCRAPRSSSSSKDQRPDCCSPILSVARRPVLRPWRALRGATGVSRSEHPVRRGRIVVVV